MIEDDDSGCSYAKQSLDAEQLSTPSFQANRSSSELPTPSIFLLTKATRNIQEGFSSESWAQLEVSAETSLPDLGTRPRGRVDVNGALLLPRRPQRSSSGEVISRVRT